MRPVNPITINPPTGGMVTSREGVRRVDSEKSIPDTCNGPKPNIFPGTNLQSRTITAATLISSARARANSTQNNGQLPDAKRGETSNRILTHATSTFSLHMPGSQRVNATGMRRLEQLHRAQRRKNTTGCYSSYTCKLRVDHAGLFLLRHLLFLECVLSILLSVSSRAVF